MLSIPVPDIANSTQDVILSGVQYEIRLTFNTRDNRWRMTILEEDTSLISGLAILESQSLLARYQLDSFNHGDLLCLRLREDELPVGRDNFGDGKPYGLIYLTNEEIIELNEG